MKLPASWVSYRSGFELTESEHGPFTVTMGVSEMFAKASLAAICALCSPAAALELRETGRYELNRPASLDYDPTFCGLWIANEGPEAVLVTLQGDELRRISSDLYRIKAIAIEGDHLLVGDGLGSLQRVSKDGTPLGVPFTLEGGFADTEGIAINSTGQIVTVEDDPERLSWFDAEGNLTTRLDTMQLSPPLSEAQGIAIDPRTGHMLIVDDWEGTNSLYEFTADGQLLAQQSLLEFGTDPEGIAIRPGSNQLFVAFDGGAKIVTFDYTPTLPEGAPPLPPGADCMMF
ncbi:hypothetical protein [Ruegeria sp. R14_0]|uniref:hypothetical protein n=1 Tax=Ruegeria sp. R14_0 TaxID=2821100 RepID=UPI001FFE0B79|nr:hypothetical protein [Ruegeria sp. R14_0]